MKWEKKGILLSLRDINIDWMQSHMQLPVPYILSETEIRLYFNSRYQGKARPAFADIQRDGNALSVKYINEHPLMDLGEAGTFDDSGIMFSSIVEHENCIYMYYIGWNQGQTVSYQNSIGLAVSEDGGRNFSRYSKGPVLARSMSDPFFTASPYVLKTDDMWIMYYLSCTGWIKEEDKMEPVYNIKFAISDDGVNWKTDVKYVCISGDEEAIAQPCVIKGIDKYRMWYCKRKKSDYRTNRENTYRIGYAESKDGFVWTRKDSIVGIDISDEGWDSEMMAYPNVIECNDRYIMFYNGNGFGKSGIGYAVAEKVN